MRDIDRIEMLPAGKRMRRPDPEPILDDLADLRRAIRRKAETFDAILTRHGFSIASSARPKLPHR